MPACGKHCPVVKAQLRKLVTNEAPWIVTEAPVKGGAVIKKTSEKLVEEKFSAAKSDSKYSEKREEGPTRAPSGSCTPSAITPAQESQREILEQKHGTAIQTDSVADRSTKAESVVEWTASKEVSWKEADQESSTRVTFATGSAQIDRAPTIDHQQQTDMSAQQSDRVEKSRDPELHEECDANCPRKISRKDQIRKLDEKQRIVDEYLLNKGTSYFDDVCTCSLSCVIRALRNDSFVRSIIFSTALFALGLKLSSELDAWFIPARCH